MRVLTRTSELEDANEMMSLEIGERRRIEGRLREAETRYRLLLEHLPAAVYSGRPTGRRPRAGRHRALHQPSARARSSGSRVRNGIAPGFWQERAPPARPRPRRSRSPSTASRRASRSAPSTATSRPTVASSGCWIARRCAPATAGSPSPVPGRDARHHRAARRPRPRRCEAEERFRRLAEEGPFVVYQFELEHGDPPVVHLRYLSPSAAELLNVPASLWGGGNLEAWFAADASGRRRAHASARGASLRHRRAVELRVPHDRGGRADRVAARPWTRDRTRRRGPPDLLPGRDARRDRGGGAARWRSRRRRRPCGRWSRRCPRRRGRR